MQLTDITISDLPDLDSLIGPFGSLASPLQLQASDDAMLVVMVFVYDVLQWL